MKEGTPKRKKQGTMSNRPVPFSVILDYIY
jgi:hypothetical protein